MVNSQLKTDPFEGTGQYVFGERFVGRKQIVLKLQKYCTTRNYAIQGLPKIGKTSLAYHSVIHQKGMVKSDKPFCPIFFDVGDCESPQNLFKQFAFLVYQETKPLLDETDAKNIDDNYKIVIESGFDNSTIKNFFLYCIHKLPISIVVVFDEFDKVRTIGFRGSDFGRLRAIATHNIHYIINSKRSIYSLENWINDHNRQPSTFYQLFQGDQTIHLSSFDDDDMKAYWDRLKPYYDNVGIQLDEQYKKEIEYYAGRHPHLLDVFNQYQYTYYEKHNCIAEFRSLRPEMKHAFDLMLEILKTEDLLDAAAQVIVGPVYDLNDEQLEGLEHYGFIRKCSSNEKRTLIGVDLGYREIDNSTNQEFSYLALSDYFTKYIKGKFANKIKYWDSWKNTLDALRQLINYFFIDNIGEDWESSTLENQPDVIYNTITEIDNLLQKDINDDIASCPLIGYLQESPIGNLIYVYWNTFEDLFSPFSREEFFERYNYLLKIRNHVAHSNDKYLSDENRQKANQYLKEIKTKLDAWFASDTKQKLIMKNEKGEIIFLKGMNLEGIIQRDANGRGHSMTNQDFPFPLPIEDKSYVALTENIGKAAQFIIGAVPDKNNPKKTHYYAEQVKLKS